MENESKINDAMSGECFVKVFFKFVHSHYILYVMEFMPGGDFRNILTKCEILEEPIAKFYLAELLLAINQFHNLGYIHRDIKPENILLDENAHIKLADFGLSEPKKTFKKEQRIVGTPDYLAPEILDKNFDVDESLDWWSFGVIMFEALVGTHPFSAGTIEEVFENVRKISISWEELDIGNK